MRKDIYKHIEYLYKRFSELWNLEEAEINKDPLVKLVLTAIAFETLDIKDRINQSDNKTAALLRDMLLPFNLVRAIPASGVIKIDPNKNIDQTVIIDDKTDFLYEKENDKKEKNSNKKIAYNFKPLIKTALIPVKTRCLFLNNKLYLYENDFSSYCKLSNGISTDKYIWIGLKTSQPLQNLHKTTLFFDFQIHSRKTIYPVRFSLYINEEKIHTCHVSEIPRSEFTNCFNEKHSADALSAAPEIYGIDNSLQLFYINHKNENNLNTDFYPEVFNEIFPGVDLNSMLTEKLLWLKIVIHSPSDYLPSDDFNIFINCVPIVNADSATIYLNRDNPIQRLPEDINKQFLSLLSDNKEDNSSFTIRDFSVERFNQNDLHREVQRLYDRFTTDYYAFKSSLSEGKELNTLKKTVSDLYSSILPEKSNVFTGIYAMLNAKTSKNDIQVTYLYTDGKSANRIPRNEILKIKKKSPYLESEAILLTEIKSGKDEASENEKEYIARYHLQTNNRLVTKEDIRAFCYKELGDELRDVKVFTGAVGTPDRLLRGIIIELQLEAKPQPDEVYYEMIAYSLRTKIEQLSTCVFPIEVKVLQKAI